MVKFTKGKKYIYLGPQKRDRSWSQEMEFALGYNVVVCTDVDPDTNHYATLAVLGKSEGEKTPSEKRRWDWSPNQEHWAEVLIDGSMLSSGDGYFYLDDRYTFAFDFGVKEAVVKPAAYEFQIIGGMMPKPSLLKLEENDNESFTPTVQYKRLTSIIDTFIQNKDKYFKAGVPHHEGIVLDGPPGTGKTTLAVQVSKHLISKGGIVVWCKTPDHFEPSVKFIRANDKDCPIMLVVDELDKINFHPKVLSTFLSGPVPLNGIITLYTTNNTKKLPDSLMRRPGRIRHRILIDKVDIEAYKKIIKERLPFIPENILNEIAEKYSGMPIDGVIQIVVNHDVYGMSIQDSLEQVLNFYRDPHRNNSNMSWNPDTGYSKIDAANQPVKAESEDDDYDEDYDEDED